MSGIWVRKPVFSCVLCCASAGDAALDQLREEKEFAEGQVGLAVVLSKYVISTKLDVLRSILYNQVLCIII